MERKSSETIISDFKVAVFNCPTFKGKDASWNKSVDFKFVTIPDCDSARNVFQDSHVLVCCFMTDICSMVELALLVEEFLFA